MSKLEKLDTNFKIQQGNAEGDLKFYDVSAEDFYVFGLQDNPKGGFCRMPGEVATAVNEQMAELYTNPAGGRLRFMTDSKSITLQVKGPKHDGGNLNRLTAAGFDMYEKRDGRWRFAWSFTPPELIGDVPEYTVSRTFPQAGMREVLFHFPLYTDVLSLRLGLDADAVLQRAPAYSHTGVVFYGSSITQGACASKPGNCFTNLLSRRLDFDYINLGFSNGARGEEAMVDYLCKLPMKVFVCDYDHNAPNAELLRNTHLPLYKRIRQAKPDIPIVFATAPRRYSMEGETILPAEEIWLERRQIILDTVNYARANGDNQVYFVDAMEFFPDEDREDALLDAAHPNDYGMVCMAKTFAKALKQIFEKMG
jgi:hypothetical protein